uniref:Uncharacterized protein n=1 Tax=Oryza punctata TaxID=4537 RepID=A0A0E0ML78_ORYPU
MYPLMTALQDTKASPSRKPQVWNYDEHAHDDLQTKDSHGCGGITRIFPFLRSSSEICILFFEKLGTRDMPFTLKGALGHAKIFAIVTWVQ